MASTSKKCGWPKTTWNLAPAIQCQSSSPHRSLSNRLTWTTRTTGSRSVFGLTSDDPLPESGEETLRAYYEYLAAKLSFPFEAIYPIQRLGFGSKTYAITVLGLLDPEEFPGEDHGLFCQARRDIEVIGLPLTEVEAGKGNENRRLIKDYAVWFVNW